MSTAKKKPKTDDERRKAFPDDNDLACYLRSAAKCERKVLDNLTTSDDWTVRLEIRGNRHGLVHCRVDESDIDRPPLSEKRVADAKKPKT